MESLIFGKWDLELLGFGEIGITRKWDFDIFEKWDYGKVGFWVRGILGKWDLGEKKFGMKDFGKVGILERKWCLRK